MHVGQALLDDAEDRDLQREGQVVHHGRQAQPGLQTRAAGEALEIAVQREVQAVLLETRRMQEIPIVMYGRAYWERVLDLKFLADEGVIESSAGLVLMMDVPSTAHRSVLTVLCTEAAVLGRIRWAARNAREAIAQTLDAQSTA